MTAKEHKNVGVKSKHTVTILIMFLLMLGIHLATNIFAGYGYFRDELYYIACSEHLDIGYVDQPPLSIYFLALSRLLFGDSLFAIRLFPAIASALSVMVLCLIVRRLNGSRMAMIVASMAFMASAGLLALNTFYSMNSFDILFWILIAYIIMLITENGSLIKWILLGIAVGLGLLNKTSTLWLGAGLAAGLLLTENRKYLKTIKPYLAGGIALVIFSPYIIWNILHEFAHLEFMGNAIAEKYSGLTRLDFLRDQLMMMNPFTYLVSIPGLYFLFFHKESRRFRILGIIFLSVFIILLLNPHTKAEYIVAAYPILFAAGGVVIEKISRGKRRFIGYALIILLVFSGITIAPFSMPLLPIETYIKYSKLIGVAPGTAENKELAELPQFLADMHGWEELARNISNVYMSIPPDERKTTVALVGNYGEAGALEFYSYKYPLPRVICTHNSYWTWGVGDTNITTFIRLGGTEDDYRESYKDIRLAGVHKCRYCMPYENNLNIFINRQRPTPIEKVWHDVKHFE